MDKSLLKKYAEYYLQNNVKVWGHDRLMQLKNTYYVDYEVEVEKGTLDFNIHAFIEAHARYSNVLRVVVDAEESSLFLAALQSGRATALYDYHNRCFIKEELI